MAYNPQTPENDTKNLYIWNITDSACKPPWSICARVGIKSLFYCRKPKTDLQIYEQCRIERLCMLDKKDDVLFSNKSSDDSSTSAQKYAVFNFCGEQPSGLFGERNIPHTSQPLNFVSSYPQTNNTQQPLFGLRKENKTETTETTSDKNYVKVKKQKKVKQKNHIK